jgi:parallel beta-helix repeat protein
MSIQRLCLSISILLLALLTASTHIQAQADTPDPNQTSGTTYYVSSSSGSDTNNGTSEDTPFQTLAHVSTLELLPSDQVLFKCGDVWRAEQLLITQSGDANSPLVFGSYPRQCEQKPLFSGLQPVSDWSQHSTNIYVADLWAGANTGKFPNGINQVFQDGERLTMGRTPNLEADGSGGYAFLEGTLDSKTLIDNELPAGNWAGAVVHVKTIRWLLLNREVTASSGNTLTLAEDVSFSYGGAEGWGYFINNHLNTLDQAGEWYYDEQNGKLYLYSTSGTPTGIEGAVVLDDDADFSGAIVMGKFKPGMHVSYVTLDNIAIKGWFANGISFPRNLEGYENNAITIQHMHIKDVEAIGMNLATWMYKPVEGDAGWRGGYNLTVKNNSIDGANHFGIHTYTRQSLFEDNTISNIGLLKNVGKEGLGCGYKGANCTENGAGVRFKGGDELYASHSNTFRYNRLEYTGHNGIDVFGHDNTFTNNVIQYACYTKGDCGAIRTFGRENFYNTKVYNITIKDNIILDTIGNTDGDAEKFKPLFGMGLYIDSYSRDVTVTGNTIANCTIDGILFQNSQGSIQNNTLYNNNAGTMNRGQVGISKDSTIAELSGNIMYGLKVHDRFHYAHTLTLSDLSSLLISNNNTFFQPYRADHIGSDGNKTLAEWQAYSNMDAQSQAGWLSLEEGESPRSELFTNQTKEAKTINLGTKAYLDLNEQPVVGSITLQPYSSRILIANGEVDLVSLSPTALDFEGIDVGTTSTTKTVTLENVSELPMHIQEIAISQGHGYAHTSDCPLSTIPLDAGKTCTLAVSFTPQQPGTHTGVLTVTLQEAPNLPFTVDLTGRGVGALSETILSFGTLPVGSDSPTQTVTLRNTSATTMTIEDVVLAGDHPEDFVLSHTCPTTMTVDAACTLDVRFAPTTTGVRRATLTIRHDGADSPYTLDLVGGYIQMYLPMVIRQG